MFLRINTAIVSAKQTCNISLHNQIKRRPLTVRLHITVQVYESYMVSGWKDFEVTRFKHGIQTKKKQKNVFIASGALDVYR